VPPAQPLRIRARPGHPDFLDLPWRTPLAGWASERLVEVARGVHRHVVQFVDYDGVLYALKELPPRLARREYRMLRQMAEAGLPVVEVIGLVERDALTGDLDDVLVTRYLDYSLPYRVVFSHRRSDDVHGLSDRLLDALAVLLVRLHAKGFFWGDCSLSNTLFRRDAGALAAYLVDAETGEWHAQLSDGQRAADLEVTQVNVAGGLWDVQAQLELSQGPDPIAVAEDLRARYERLWDELTRVEVIGEHERYRIEARMRRLNDLGFDVDEVELLATPDGDRLVLRTAVTEQGHHRRRLFQLTGLQAQENQARSLLNDLANFRATIERERGRTLPEPVAAYQWLDQVFLPTVAAIPSEHRGKLEAAEVFHEVIEHKWYLSEMAGRDVGVDEAVASYMAEVLPAAPEERTVLASADDAAAGWIGYG
jgi:tRNA A-37 threonylcarbamoyl transferase component Bud32